MNFMFQVVGYGVGVGDYWFECDGDCGIFEVVIEEYFKIFVEYLGMVYDFVQVW